MRKSVVPLAVFLLAILGPAWLIMRGNNGHFVYTLDDSYIHLALSENISNGHYGINSSENSAPSSSIIWPLILVPFVSFSSAFVIPFYLNAVLGLLTVFLLRGFYGGNGVLFATASVFAFNLAGLVFTGMEHSLQLLAVVVIAAGLRGYIDSGRVSKRLIFFVVAAPLVRYECLAVSIPVLLFLFFRGEKKMSVMVFTTMAVLLGAFSLFLHSLGLDFLPASVNAKSAVVGNSGSISSVLGNLSDSVLSFRGITQLAVLVPVAAVVVSKRRESSERLLAAAVIGAVMLHLLVGRSGWFHRYGAYMWAFSILMCFQLYRKFVNKHSIISVAILLLLSADYLSGYTKIPAASHNIYQQQYQMRRFVHGWLREPVAVNDLGLVSMGYNMYVLDLWGLATPSALLGSANSVWVDSAAAENGVGTAIVYREEIQGLSNWTPVARMEISPPLVVCVSGGVDFLAAPWVSADSLGAKLKDFSETLPEGIDLVIFR